MRRSTALAAALSGTLAASAAWAENVTIEVGYPYSALFDVTFERIMPLFKEAHPDIDVKFRATYDNYEGRHQHHPARVGRRQAARHHVLRASTARRLLVEKGIAKSLEPFIAKEADFSKDGYHEAMLDLGTFGGEVHRTAVRGPPCRWATTTWTP